MNEDNKKSKIDSLMDGETVTEGVTDWEARCHELENKLNGVRVEEGRVKKLDDELKATKAELEKIRESKTSEDLMSGLSEDERAGVPEEVLQATAKMVRKAQDDSDRRMREMEERRNAEADATRKSNMERFIDQRFPGFFADVGPGGDKAKAWNSFLRYNGDSIRSAMTAGNIESVEYHIARFYSDHLGIPVPSGIQSGSAAPDPRAIGGGSTSGGMATSGKTYTADEFMALYDAVERARDEGNYAEIARLNAEIKSAPAEGRVK